MKILANLTYIYFIFDWKIIEKYFAEYSSNSNTWRKILEYFKTGIRPTLIHNDWIEVQTANKSNNKQVETKIPAMK